MMTIDPTIVTRLRKDGLLREGHFAYRSGRHSAGLIDRDRLLADPEFASRLGYAIAKRFFVDHIDTIATPSIWGAGLAQWVAYFLEPRAKVVDATPKNGLLTVAPRLADLIDGRRVLLLDNVIISGETMTGFAETIIDAGATVVGIGTLWNSGEDEIAGYPVYGLVNRLYEAFPVGACPLCNTDPSKPPEPVGY
jgi:orotate phosphoribosyltransferase